MDFQFEPGPSQHWNFTWAGVPYHAVRITHVPILDRPDGVSTTPQTLTIVYASPTVRIRQQVKVAGVSIALASLLLLGATTWLASWKIRRSLSPLQSLGAAGFSGLDPELETGNPAGSPGAR